jgi:hypothetical protein
MNVGSRVRLLEVFKSTPGGVLLDIWSGGREAHLRRRVFAPATAPTAERRMWPISTQVNKPETDDRASKAPRPRFCPGDTYLNALSAAGEFGRGGSDKIYLAGVSVRWVDDITNWRLLYSSCSSLSLNIVF